METLRRTRSNPAGGGPGVPARHRGRGRHIVRATTSSRRHRAVTGDNEGCWRRSSRPQSSDAIERLGIQCGCRAPSRWQQVAEPFIPLRTIRHSRRAGRDPGGGTGALLHHHTTAALRAARWGDVLSKATQVDGITRRPDPDPTATPIRHLSYLEVLTRPRCHGHTALTLVMTTHARSSCFDLPRRGNLERVVPGRRRHPR